MVYKYFYKQIVHISAYLYRISCHKFGDDFRTHKCSYLNLRNYAIINDLCLLPWLLTYIHDDDCTIETRSSL